MRISKSFFLLFFIFKTFRSYVLCPDGSKCPDDSKCCENHVGYACCEGINSTCCGDHNHCCINDNKCDLNLKRCLDNTGKESNLIELTHTSLIYKKGWNELFYNCKEDFINIKDDLKHIINYLLFDFRLAKEYFITLIADGIITKNDCIKFIKEVFG